MKQPFDLAPRPGLAGWLPWIAWTYPATAALLGRSEIPLWFGRFSASLLAFNALSVGLVALAIVAWRRRSGALQGLSLVLLAVVTFAAPASNALRLLPGVSWWMPLVRLLCGAALVSLAFRSRAAGRAAGGWLALGAALAALAALDYALLAVLATLPSHRQQDPGLREEYALERIGPGDFVIVGDSFVWGQGVTAEERFGDRLERELQGTGAPAVYSLGLIGAGLPQYARLLRRIPDGVTARRVIIAFYMNDMPEIATPRRSVQNLATALGRSSPAVRWVGDGVAKLLAGDVEDYHRHVIDSLDPGGPAYSERWELLRQGLSGLRELAARRSRERPGLVLLPLMVDYSSYPLVEGHERLAAAGLELGFDVLDLGPVFRAVLGDGRAHRASPGDNHWDAATHALVARTLAGWLLGHGESETAAAATGGWKRAPVSSRLGGTAGSEERHE